MKKYLAMTIIALAMIVVAALGTSPAHSMPDDHAPNLQQVWLYQPCDKTTTVDCFDNTAKYPHYVLPSKDGKVCNVWYSERRLKRVGIKCFTPVSMS